MSWMTCNYFDNCVVSFSTCRPNRAGWFHRKHHHCDSAGNSTAQGCVEKGLDGHRAKASLVFPRSRLNASYMVFRRPVRFCGGEARVWIELCPAVYVHRGAYGASPSYRAQVSLGREDHPSFTIEQSRSSSSLLCI